MKIFLIVLQIFSCTIILAQKVKVAKSEKAVAERICEITYVANEGFLLETRNRKILIDALFGNIDGNWCDQPNDSLLGKMKYGAPPFDNIDLVLITHKHVDHFNKQLTINFLRNNLKSILICPNQVNEVLINDEDYSKISDRIISLKPTNQFDTTMISKEIKIRVFRFNHGSFYQKDSITGEPINIHKDIENFGYLIELNGFTFFHSGDDNPINVSQYKAYNFRELKIDVAFLDRVFLTPKGIDLVKEFIKTKHLVYMHINPSGKGFYQSIKNLPGAIPQIIIFSKPLEKKQISLSDNRIIN